MKTAVSLPDHLFKQAESFAAGNKMSRSALYAAAIREYLKAREDDAVTAKLDEIYQAKTEDDIFIIEAQARSVHKLDEW